MRALKAFYLPLILLLFTSTQVQAKSAQCTHSSSQVRKICNPTLASHSKTFNPWQKKDPFTAIYPEFIPNITLEIQSCAKTVAKCFNDCTSNIALKMKYPLSALLNVEKLNTDPMSDHAFCDTGAKHFISAQKEACNALKKQLPHSPHYNLLKAHKDFATLNRQCQQLLGRKTGNLNMAAHDEKMQAKTPAAPVISAMSRSHAQSENIKDVASTETLAGEKALKPTPTPISASKESTSQLPAESIVIKSGAQNTISDTAGDSDLSVSDRSVFADLAAAAHSAGNNMNGGGQGVSRGSLRTIRDSSPSFTGSSTAMDFPNVPGSSANFRAPTPGNLDNSPSSQVPMSLKNIKTIKAKKAPQGQQASLAPPRRGGSPGAPVRFQPSSSPTKPSTKNQITSPPFPLMTINQKNGDFIIPLTPLFLEQPQGRQQLPSYQTIQI